MPEPSDYLPSRDAAALAGCTTRWLRKLAERGVVRAVRRGERGRLLFDRRSVERLLRPAATNGHREASS